MQNEKMFHDGDRDPTRKQRKRDGDRKGSRYAKENDGLNSRGDSSKSRRRNVGDRTMVSI